jgi:hypothetical protein
MELRFWYPDELLGHLNVLGGYDFSKALVIFQIIWR